MQQAAGRCLGFQAVLSGLGYGLLTCTRLPWCSWPGQVLLYCFAADQRWRVELPDVGASDDLFGGCRSIERSYIKDKQIGEGTYGEASAGQRQHSAAAAFKLLHDKH